MRVRTRRADVGVGESVPVLLRANGQGELNFHNFATRFWENAYYGGAFCFLVLLPFLQDRAGLFQRWPSISFFVPSRFVMMAAAVSAAYATSPPDVFRRTPFYMTLAILVYYAWSFRSSREVWLVLSLLVVMAATHWLFLGLQHRLVRSWDPTEYREMFIPLGFVAYSAELLLHSKARSARCPLP